MHFYYSSHHLRKGACTAGVHSDGKKKKERKKKGKRSRDVRKREGTVNTHFLPRHPSEKEQRDKRSRWMEMELMVKESVTGSNKSKRE